MLESNFGRAVLDKGWSWNDSEIRRVCFHDDFKMQREMAISGDLRDIHGL